MRRHLAGSVRNITNRRVGNMQKPDVDDNAISSTFRSLLRQCSFCRPPTRRPSNGSETKNAIAYTPDECEKSDRDNPVPAATLPGRQPPSPNLGTHHCETPSRIHAVTPRSPQNVRVAAGSRGGAVRRRGNRTTGPPTGRRFAGPATELRSEPNPIRRRPSVSPRLPALQKKESILFGRWFFFTAALRTVLSTCA